MKVTGVKVFTQDAIVNVQMKFSASQEGDNISNLKLLRVNKETGATLVHNAYMGPNLEWLIPGALGTSYPVDMALANEIVQDLQYADPLSWYGWDPR